MMGCLGFGLIVLARHDSRMAMLQPVVAALLAELRYGSRTLDTDPKRQNVRYIMKPGETRLGGPVVQL